MTLNYLGGINLMQIRAKIESLLAERDQLANQLAGLDINKVLKNLDPLIVDKANRVYDYLIKKASKPITANDSSAILYADIISAAKTIRPFDIAAAIRAAHGSSGVSNEKSSVAGLAQSGWQKLRGLVTPATLNADEERNQLMVEEAQNDDVAKILPYIITLRQFKERLITADETCLLIIDEASAPIIQDALKHFSALLSKLTAYIDHPQNIITLKNELSNQLASLVDSQLNQEIADFNEEVAAITQLSLTYPELHDIETANCNQLQTDIARLNRYIKKVGENLRYLGQSTERMRSLEERLNYSRQRSIGLLVGSLQSKLKSHFYSENFAQLLSQLDFLQRQLVSCDIETRVDRSSMELAAVDFNAETIVAPLASLVSPFEAQSLMREFQRLNSQLQTFLANFKHGETVIPIASCRNINAQIVDIKTKLDPLFNQIAQFIFNLCVHDKSPDLMPLSIESWQTLQDALCKEINLVMSNNPVIRHKILQLETKYAAKYAEIEKIASAPRTVRNQPREAIDLRLRDRFEKELLTVLCKEEFPAEKARMIYKELYNHYMALTLVLKQIEKYGQYLIKSVSIFRRGLNSIFKSKDEESNEAVFILDESNEKYATAKEAAANVRLDQVGEVELKHKIRLKDEIISIILMPRADIDSAKKILLQLQAFIKRNGVRKVCAMTESLLAADIEKLNQESLSHSQRMYKRVASFIEKSLTDKPVTLDIASGNSNSQSASTSSLSFIRRGEQC